MPAIDNCVQGRRRVLAAAATLLGGGSLLAYAANRLEGFPFGRAQSIHLVPPTVPIPKTYLGMHIHRADAGTAWPSVKFGTWRLVDAYVNWFDIQPGRGKWNFAKLDRYLAMASLADVEVIVPLMMTPTWASSRPSERGPYQPGNAAPPLEMNDWRTYVRVLADRYKGRVRAYEIWNEVNAPEFFSGTTDTLMDMIRIASEEIRLRDPAAWIISPSMTGGGEKAYTMLTEMLRMGLAGHVDVLGYHFYTPNETPEAMLPMVARVKDILVKTGASRLPIWNTETGWWIANGDGSPEGKGVHPSWRRVDADLAPAFVARALILGWATGIERYCWYAWDHGSMGLIEPGTKVLKPAGRAMTTVIDWLTGSAMRACEVRDRVWSCELRRANGQSAWIVWTEEGSANWPLPDQHKHWVTQSVNQDRPGALPGVSKMLTATPMPQLVYFQEDQV